MKVVVVVVAVMLVVKIVVFVEQPRQHRVCFTFVNMFAEYLALIYKLS